MTGKAKKRATSRKKGPDERLPVSAYPASAEAYPLSERLLELLRSAGIRTVGELAAHSADDLALVPGFGQKSLRQVRVYLARRGLDLATEGRGGPPGAGERHGRAGGLEPLVEQRLMDARLWRPASREGGGTLRPGTSVRELLGAPGLSPEQRDAALTFLAARGMLPRPRGPEELLGLVAACAQVREAIGRAAPRLDVAFGTGRLGGRQDYRYRDLYTSAERLRDALSRGRFYRCDSGPGAAAEVFEAAARLARGQEHQGSLHARALLDWPPLARANAVMDPPARTLGGLLQALTRNDPRLPPPGDPAEISARPTLDDALELLASLLRPDLDSELLHLFTGLAPLGRDARRAVLDAFGGGAPPDGPVAAPAHEAARALSRAYLTEPLPRLRTAGVLLSEDRFPTPNEAVAHRRLADRRLARSPSTTRHALAVLAAVGHAAAPTGTPAQT